MPSPISCSAVPPRLRPAIRRTGRAWYPVWNAGSTYAMAAEAGADAALVVHAAIGASLSVEGREVPVVTAPGAHPQGAGVVVTADFEFDVPVRFDTDHLDPSIDDFGTRSWESITLVELK